MSEHAIFNIPPELIEALLNNPWDAHLLVDKEGILRFISSSNEAFYQTTAKKSIGRHISELNPQSGLPRVIHTGKPEIAEPFEFRGKKRVVSRIPLRDREGNIVGAIGKLMFWHSDQVNHLHRQVEVLESRIQYYEKELKDLYQTRRSVDNIVGESLPMQEAKHIAVRAALTDLAVLITGETGTGKEIFANAIHQMSLRKDYPFVRVNCASIPINLIESELFGYEAGAFTGATRQGKAGKFELADKGTIFLDEVGDMPLAMQPKLLRVLQEHEVQRLGGTRTLKLDFRIIAATNRNLKSMIQKRTFRQDLFYRLNIFNLETPPLRSIRADIPRIAYLFISKLHSRNPNTPTRISAPALKCLSEYYWPGNVRELQNVLERTAATCQEAIIQKQDLPTELQEPLTIALEPDGKWKPKPLTEERALCERRAVERTLRYTHGNRTRAAQLLGIHRTGLYQKMKRYNIVTV